MNESKNTKKALHASLVSLFLCIVMLIGTTFAWFTDSASTGVNKIQAGNLNVELNYWDGDSWENAENKQLFNSEKWEPGYMEVQGLQVKNAGNLALKWKAAINSTKELSGLADVIDVYVKAGADYSYVKPANREEVTNSWTKAGTLKEFVNGIETTTYGSLKAEEKADLGLALVMSTEAGNKYQGMDLGGDITVTILATQDTVESDSFGDQYDVKALYPVANKTEFAEVIKDLQSDEAIQLANDITIDSVIPQSTSGVTNIDLNGNTLSTKAITNTTVEDGDVLNIKNGDIVAKDLKAVNSVIDVMAGSELNLENVTIESSEVALYAQGKDAVINATDSTIKASYYCVTTNASGSENYNPVFNLKNCTLEGDSPVLVNVPCNLNMEKCTVNAGMHGVIVRGGTALIKDCTITMNEPKGDLANYFDKRDWATGNEVNLAGLTIGNKKSGAYQYPSDVTLINTKVTSVNPAYPAVYIIGNTGSGLGATLKYDAQSTFGGDIVRGNEAVTVTRQ